jgi:hypothetical protein
MNACDILHYGHTFVLRILDGLPEEDWSTPNVCGVWSTKEIIAHLASFDQMLVELLGQFLGDTGPTPALDVYKEDGQKFNDTQVPMRHSMTVAEQRAEYDDTHARTVELAARIPEETLRQPGTLPWYGMEYSLDDFIVYTFYGHQREHGAQIAVFRDKIGR